MATPQTYTPVTTPYFSHLLIDSGLPTSTADFYWVYAPNLKVPFLEYNKNLAWQRYRDIRGIEDCTDRLPCWSIAKLVGMLPEFIELSSNSYDEATDTEYFSKIRCDLVMEKSFIGYKSVGDEDAYEFHVSGDFNKCVVRTLEWLLDKCLIQSQSEVDADVDFEDDEDLEEQ